MTKQTGHANPMMNKNKQTASASTAGGGFYWLFLLWLAAIYVYLLYATGWVSDDARITFVYVENLVKGNGAVFNLGERVQAYTHTLWFLLLSAGTYIWHNPTQVAYFVSVALSTLSFVLLGKIAVQRNLYTILIIGSLLLSAGFVDYSTSGLENPLSYLLFSLLVVAARSERRPDRQFVDCGLLSSLIFLNRPDYALVVFPLLFYLWLRVDGWSRRIQLAIVVALPVLAWTAFSLFYYGVPVPNTAYAKLGTGLPRNESIWQGLHYYLATARYDCITLLILCLCLPCCLWWGNARVRLVAAGTLLYLAYIVWIGGDFMLSRHFAVPVYLAVALLLSVSFGAPSPNYLRSLGIAVLALLALTLAAPMFHQTTAMRTGQHFYYGISDERFFWSRFSNLKKDLQNGPRQWLPSKAAAKKDTEPGQVKIMCGWLGLAKALDLATHLVDKCGLTDPLLARMPALTVPEWRIGHFERAIPLGYLASIADGKALIDPRLSGYASQLRLVTHGGLLDTGRLQAIVSQNLSNGEFETIAADYRVDVVQLQEIKAHHRDLTYAAGVEDAVELTRHGASWRVLPGTQAAPSKMALRSTRSGRYQLILEYADLANYEPEGEYNWQQVDYVVAVLDAVDGNTIKFDLPDTGAMRDLVYVHVVPFDPVNGPARVSLALL